MKENGRTKNNGTTNNCYENISISSATHCSSLPVILDQLVYQLIQVTDEKRTTANGELQIHRLRGWAELELSSRDTNLILKLSD